MPVHYIGYGFGYGIDVGYYAVALVALVLGLAAQAYIKRVYAKWSHVPAGSGATGADVARGMLAEAGASGVGITTVAGTLTDFYDPRDNKLHLSQDNYRGGSVASVAVACHEAGHAVQAAKGFGFYRLRSALVPAVSLAERGWVIVLLLGVFTSSLGLVQVAIALYGLSVLFHLVTLPVEIDASRRAVAYLGSRGSAIDQRGAREVLTAAALTYVAAALASLIQLLYLVSRYGGRGGRD